MLQCELWHWLRTPPGMWAKLESQGSVIWLPDGRMRVDGAGNGSPKQSGKVLWSWMSRPRRKEPTLAGFGPRHARGDGKLREQPSVGGGGWPFCLRGGTLWLRRVREALLHLCVLWHCGHKMDDNGSPRQTAGEETSSPDSHRPDVRWQRRVAAVSSPALPGARLTLPGVMDAEGRVDESRLRMHIFKNGRKLNNRGTHYRSHAYLHPMWLLARTSDFSYIYS